MRSREKRLWSPGVHPGSGKQLLKRLPVKEHM